MVEHVGANASRGLVGYRSLGGCAPLDASLALEVAAARVGRRRSRGSPAAAAARRCPGSCSAKVDPGAIDRLAARLPQGSVLVSATNGKTTTTAMVAEILRPRRPARVQPLGREPRLGRRLRPARAPTAPSSGCSRSTRRALPEVARRVRPQALAARQPLPRPARPLRRARARRRALARRGRGAARTRSSSSTPTIRCSASSRAAGAGSRRPSASTTRAHARPALQHAADSKYCLRCGTPYDYAAAYVGHLGDYRCPNGGHAPAAARRRGARDRAARARRRARSRSSTPAGSARVELALPGLYNVYNALAAAALARALGVPLDEIVAGARALLGRVRALRADHDRRPRPADAADQEPGRRERGRAHARSTATPPRVAVDRAQRRDRRRPRRLVDLGRRLRAAARRARHARRDRRSRAAELALRFAYGGLDARRGSRSCRRSRPPSTAASS